MLLDTEINEIRIIFWILFHLWQPFGGEVQAAREKQGETLLCPALARYYGKSFFLAHYSFPPVMCRRPSLIAVSVPRIFLILTRKTTLPPSSVPLPVVTSICAVLGCHSDGLGARVLLVEHFHRGLLCSNVFCSQNLD